MEIIFKRYEKPVEKSDNQMHFAVQTLPLFLFQKPLDGKRNLLSCSAVAIEENM